MFALKHATKLRSLGMTSSMPAMSEAFQSAIRSMSSSTDGTIVWGPDGRIAPHGGGPLVDLRVPASAAASLVSSVNHKVELNERQACDVELLTVGGFTPLDGFLNEDAYTSVVENMRLPNGTPFGLPVVMDTFNDSIKPGQRLLLTYKGQNIAVMDVESLYKPNKVKEVKACYGSSSLEHPAVTMVAWERGPYYLGGKITGLDLPKRVFPCATPAEDDDIPGIVRYHTYEVLQKEVDNPRVKWAYLPYSMHMAGPREAIQHMIMRKNYGCTHFIIGRDMAGCKSSLDGEDFYGAYDAQDFAKSHAKELGMKTVPSPDIAYTEEKGYVSAAVAKEEKLTLKKLSGTKFRQMLRGGEDIPEWFAFKSVVQVLRDHQQHAPQK
ncbi:hypothetical protein Ndes2437B_g01418 [Nannochloris sp. 'desiccata']